MAVSSNAIEFIINTKSEAEKVFNGIKTAIDKTTLATTLVNAQFSALTLAILKLSSSGIANLSRLQNVVVGIKNTLFETQVGQTFLQEFDRLATEALTQTTKLSSIIGVASQSAGIFTREFVNLQSSSVVDDIGTRFATSIQGQSENLLQLAREYAPRLATAFNSAEAGLADVALQQVINQRIPEPIRVGLEFAGIDAGANITQFLGNEEQIRSLINSQALEQLISGSLVGGINTVLTNRLTNAFRTAFAQINTFVTDFARRTGENAGRNFVTGAQSNFQILDAATGGILRNLTDSLAGALAGFVPQGLVRDIAANLTSGLSTSIFNLLPNSVGQAFTQFISGFLTTRITRAVSVAFGRAFSQGFAQLNLDGILGGLPIQGIAGAIGNLFPSTRNITESIQRDIANVGTDFAELVRTLSQPGVERANENIARLQQELAALGNVDIDALTQEGLDLFAQGNIDAQGQARIDEILSTIDSIENINQSIAEAERELEGFAANNARREVLEDQRVNILLQLEDPSIPVEQVRAALQDINQELQSLDIGLQSPIERFFNAVRRDLTNLFGREFVDNIENNIRTGLATIDTAFDNVFSEALREIGTNAGVAFAEGFSSQVGNAIAPTVDLIDDAVRGSLDAIKSIPGRFEEPLAQLGGGLGILAGIRDPLDVLDLVRQNTQAAFTTLSRLGEQLTFFSSGLSVLRGVVENGPFKLLIQQNVTLREQLLSTQSSLVSTQKIVNKFTGAAIADSTKAIQALTLPVRQAIRELRRDSLDLVGVTSGQLIESFQITAGEAGAIGASLTDVKDLTISFAAALGTLRIPLFQSRQEITSIVQGTIDQNSALAKSIGLTNTLVRQWKSQGVLVDKILERLAAFREGNKLAAQSVAGITSNIQEVIENIGLAAGANLVDPIVKELSKVFDFLNSSADQITKSVTRIATIIFEGIQSTFAGLKTVFGASQEIFVALPDFFGTSLGNFLQVLGEVLVSTTKVLEPFIKVLGGVAGALRPIGSPLLKFAVTAFVLSRGIRLLSSIAGTFAQILPGIGELLFGVNLRLLPIVNLLPTLTGQLGLGAGGFLALGKSLNSIPGAAKAATVFLSRFLGPFAPLVTGLIPQVASLGVQLVGLSTVFPPLRTGIQRLLAANPSSVVKAIGLAIKGLPLASTIPLVGQLGDQFIGLSQAVARNTQATTVSTLATNAFRTALRAAAVQVRTFLINTALIAGVLIAAFKAFDTFILQNEELTEVIQGVIGGLIGFAVNLGKLATSNSWVTLSIAIATATIAIVTFNQALITLIGIQIASWAGFTAAALLRLADVLAKLAFTDSLFAIARGFTASSAAVNAFAASINFLSFSSIAAGAREAALGIQFLTLQIKTGALFAGGFAAALAKLQVAFAAIAGGVAALAAPIALVVAGLAAIGSITFTNALKQALELQESAQKTTNLITQISFQSANQINKLLDEQADKRRNGIALAEEELQANRVALRNAQNNIKEINRQIATIKQRKREEEKGLFTSKVVVKGYEQQLESLQKTLSILEEITAQVSIQNRDIADIGSLNSQLEARARTLEEAITNADGQEAKFKANIEEFIQSTQTLLDRGVISAEEAERRILLIAGNFKVASETQIKAREALIAVYQQEEEAINRLQAKNRELLEQAEADRLLNLQRLLAFNSDRGQFDEAEIQSQIKLTRLQIEQGQIRIKEAKDRAAEITKNSIEQRKKLEKEIEKATTIDVGGRKVKVNLESFDGGEEIKKQIETLQNEAKGNALLTEKQLAEIESRRRQDIKATSDLQRKLIDLEVKAFDVSIARRKRALDRLNQNLRNQIDAQNQDLNKQLTIYESIEKSLQIQSQLLQARQQLASSQTSALEKQIDFLAKTEQNELRRRRLIEAASAIRLKGLLTAQEIERQNLAIQQEQNRIALVREQIQNRIAQSQQVATIAQTEAELAQARLDKRIPLEQVRAIELKLGGQLEALTGLASLGKLLETQAANQQLQNELARKNLAINQQSARFEAKQAVAGTIVNRSLRKRFQESLENEALDSLGAATGQFFKNTEQFLKSVRPFSADIFRSQIPPSQAKPSGFIEFEGGRRVEIESLVNQQQQSFAVLADGTKRQINETTELKKSFIDFGDRIEKITTVPDVRQFAPEALNPANIPLPSIDNLAASIEQNFGFFRTGVSDIVSAIGNLREQTVFNIEINAPNKTINQSGVSDAAQPVNLDNVLDRAKALAGVF